MRKTLNFHSMKEFRQKMMALLAVVLFGGGSLFAQEALVTNTFEFKDQLASQTDYTCGIGVFFGDNQTPNNYVSPSVDTTYARVFCANVGTGTKANITFTRDVQLFTGDSLVIFKGKRPNPGYASDYEVVHDGTELITNGYTFVSSGPEEQCLTLQVRIKAASNPTATAGFSAILGDQFTCETPGPEITIDGQPGIGVAKVCKDDDVEIEMTIDDPSSAYGRSINELDFYYEVTRFNGISLSTVETGTVTGGTNNVFNTTLSSVSPGVYEVVFAWTENNNGINQKCCTDTIRRYIQVAPEAVFDLNSPAPLTGGSFYACESSDITLSADASSVTVEGHPNNPTQTEFEVVYNIGQWRYIDDNGVEQVIGNNGDQFVPEDMPNMERRGTTSDYRLIYVTNAQQFGCEERFEFELDIAKKVSAGLADNNVVVCADRGSDFAVLEVLDGASEIGEANVSSVEYDTLQTPYFSNNGTFSIGNAATDEFNDLNGALNLTALQFFGTYRFQYTVHGVGDAPYTCPSDVVAVQVDVQYPPHAGEGDKDVDVCEGATLDLDGYVGPSPDYRGIMANPDQSGSYINVDGQGTLAGANLSLTGIDFTASNPAIARYRYVVNSGDCGNDTATIRLRIHKEPYAGENTTINVCSSEPAFKITDVLNTVGGKEVSETGTFFFESSTEGLNYDASVWNANGKIVPGDQSTYSQTDEFVIRYEATNAIGCEPDISFLTVKFQLEPYAGVDITKTVCETAGTGGELNLHTIIGTPVNQYPEKSGGVWSEASGFMTGLDVNTGELDLSAALDANPTGTFEFNYLINGFGNCVSSDATLNLTIEREVGPGTTDDYYFCDSDAEVVLASFIGAELGGTWSGADVDVLDGTDDQAKFNPIGLGTIDGLPGFNVKYKIDNSACADAEWIARIQVFEDPKAGTDNVDEVELCKDAVDVDLMEFRKGDYEETGNSVRISFFDETNNRPINVVGGTAEIDFNPSSGVNVFAPGLHNFYYIVKRVVPGTSPAQVVCIDSALIQINVLAAPFAGSNGAFTVLSTGGIVNLPGIISGAAPVGEFTNLSGGGVNGEDFDPSQATKFANVIHHVSIAGQDNDGCRDTSLIMGYVLREMETGDDGTLVACETNSIDLFQGLQGSPVTDNLSQTEGVAYLDQGWELGMTPSDMNDNPCLKSLFTNNNNLNNIINSAPGGTANDYLDNVAPAQIESTLDVTLFIDDIGDAAPTPVVFTSSQSVANAKDRLDIPRCFQTEYRMDYVMRYNVSSMNTLRDDEFTMNQTQYEFMTNIDVDDLNYDLNGITTEERSSVMLEVSRNFNDMFEFDPDNEMLALCAGETQISLNKWIKGKADVVLPTGFRFVDYIDQQHELDRDSVRFVLDGDQNHPAITYALGDAYLSTTDLEPGEYTIEVKIFTSEGEAECGEVLVPGIEFEIFEKPHAGPDLEIDLCLESSIQVFNELRNVDPDINEEGNVGRFFGRGGNDWDPNDLSVLSGYTWLANPNPTGTSTPIGEGPYDIFYAVQAEEGCYIDNNRGNALLSDTAVVRANVIDKPSVGTPAYDSEGMIYICENFTFDPIILIPGADQGGEWSDVTGTGGLSVNGGGTSFQPDIVPTPGAVTLNYIIDNGICDAEEVDVNFTVIYDPEAGIESSEIVCGNQTGANIFDLINGADPTPQGEWSGDIPNQFFSGNLLNAQAVGEGVYDVTYTIFSHECRGFDEETGLLDLGGGAVLKDEVTIELEIERLPEAGTDNSELTAVCGDDDRVNLLGILNGFPDNTGTWASVDAEPGSIIGHFFDARDNAGDSLTFVYTVEGVVCPADQATIEVDVKTPADAKGTREFAVCFEETSENLYDNYGYPLLGGDWFRITSGGVQIPIAENDAVNFDYRSLGVGESTLMFIMDAKFPCTPDTGYVKIDVAPAPNSGADTLVSICTGVLLQDLTTFLEGHNQIGEFKHIDNPVFISGTNLDVQAAGAGIIEGDFKTLEILHITSNAPCAKDTSVLTVNVFPRPNAGGNLTVDVCNGLGTLNLLDIVGPGAFQGGVFSTFDNTILVEDALDGTELNLELLPEGSYDVYYKVSLPAEAVNPIGCQFDQAKLTINVLPLGEQDVFMCVDRQVVDLNDYLLADVNGTWVVTSGSATVNGSLTNPLVAGTGSNVFELQDADVFCPSGIILNAEIVEPIKVSDEGITVACEAGDPTYTITFKIEGGQPGTYVVDQGPTTYDYNPATGVFTFEFQMNHAYDIVLVDGISCNPLPIVGYPDCTDFDGDGIVNSNDKDDDNDGVPDTAESFGFDGLADHDGDKIPNAKDGDFCIANGGVMNSTATCSLFDVDGDGLLSQLETDSDNDGIFDLYEVYFDQAIAVDADGILDGANLTGMTDGWSDEAQNFFVGGGSIAANTDGDNLPDFLDTDSDNDGIDDAVEAAGGVVDTDNDGTDDYRDADSDDDSIDDVYEGAADMDGDGIMNFRDEDADGDGIDDVQERITPITSAPEDIDNDGQFNFLDLDSDGDLIPDAVEAFVDGETALSNIDGDLFEDFRDTDSDDDGISDAIEAGSNPAQPVNSDVFDGNDDGLADFRDTDSDDDGTSDTEEALDVTNPNDADGDGIADYREIDSDNDGIADEIEREIDKNEDMDGDQIPDYRDMDSDGDGILDRDEAFFEADLRTPTDLSNADGNLIEARRDNTFNHKDLDSDGDGISDSKENGTIALEKGYSQDADNDGLKNFVDFDSDGDGVPDHIEGEVDCDGDGIPAYLDNGDNCQIKIANIPNAISPNGDAINDFWIVPNIADFPGNKVQIFNRWGNLVYEKENYDNTWNGSTENNFIGDEALPTGTYFYVIDLNLGQDPIKGYIYLNKGE